MFRLKYISFVVSLYFFFSFSLSPALALDAIELLGSRDEVIEKLESEGIEDKGYYDYETEEYLDAYDWLVENAENEEILQYALDKWGDNYIMLKYVYEIQKEAYYWLKEETDFEKVMLLAVENPNLHDKENYEVIKSIYEKDVSSSSFAIHTFVIYLLFLMAFNFLFFLIFLKDMLCRRCNIFKWFLAIVLVGPIGIIFYLTFRNLKEGEKRKERIRYSLSRYFIIWWNVYIFALFILTILMFLAISLLEGVPIHDFEYIGEFIFWLGLMFAVIVVPGFIVFPSIIATTIMLISKRK